MIIIDFQERQKKKKFVLLSGTVSFLFCYSSLSAITYELLYVVYG